MLAKILYSFFIVIIITIKESNQEITNQMEFPLFPVLPNIVRMAAEKHSELSKVQKRETVPEGRAGIEDIAKPLGGSAFGPLASGLMNSPKQIMVGMFQAMVMDAPKPGDVAGNFQNFGGLIGGGSK